MKSLVKTCGLAALVLSAACLSVTDAQAGGRRCAYQHQTYYYAAPAPVAMNTAPAPAMAATNGTQRYQSAYQAPVNTGNTFYAPSRSFYNQNESIDFAPVRFQDRSFSNQWDAGRKIRGY